MRIANGVLSAVKPVSLRTSLHTTRGKSTPLPGDSIAFSALMRRVTFPWTLLWKEMMSSPAFSSFRQSSMFSPRISSIPHGATRSSRCSISLPSPQLPHSRFAHTAAVYPWAHHWHFGLRRYWWDSFLSRAPTRRWYRCLLRKRHGPKPFLIWCTPSGDSFCSPHAQ